MNIVTPPTIKPFPCPTKGCPAMLSVPAAAVKRLAETGKASLFCEGCSTVHLFSASGGWGAPQESIPGTGDSPSLLTACL